MKEYIDKVKEFHKAFKLEQSQNYSAHPDCFVLRYDLLKEENEEYFHACTKEDNTEIADALGDMLYVLCGTIISHGLEDKIGAIFEEIHKSNMSKLDKDGNPLYNPNGKVAKSDQYFKPDIKKVLENA